VQKYDFVFICQNYFAINSTIADVAGTGGERAIGEGLLSFSCKA
jgi:hypothetical protein